MSPVIYICDVCGKEIKDKPPEYYLNPYYLKVKHKDCPKKMREKQKAIIEDKIAGVYQKCPSCGVEFYGYFFYGKQLIEEFLEDLKIIDDLDIGDSVLPDEFLDIMEKWTERKEALKK